MGSNFFGAVIAFVIGVGISSLNYLFSRLMIKKKPEIYASSHILRQLLQVGFLVLILCFGDATPWDKTWLLVGGALGVSLPMLWFTYRLVKINDSSKSEGESSDE